MVVAAVGCAVGEIRSEDVDVDVADVGGDSDGNLQGRLVPAEHVDDGDVDESTGDDRLGRGGQSGDGEGAGCGSRDDGASNETVHGVLLGR